MQINANVIVKPCEYGNNELKPTTHFSHPSH
jgi:hypothetical protein